MPWVRFSWPKFTIITQWLISLISDPHVITRAELIEEDDTSQYSKPKYAYHSTIQILKVEFETIDTRHSSVVNNVFDIVKTIFREHQTEQRSHTTE